VLKGLGAEGFVDKRVGGRDFMGRSEGINGWECVSKSYYTSINDQSPEFGGETFGARMT